jgi:hypothetical protein
VNGFWEIEASISPIREFLADDSTHVLVRVQIMDPGSAEDSPMPSSICDPHARGGSRSELLAAADDADWQTEQDGCPEPTR